LPDRSSRLATIKTGPSHRTAARVDRPAAERKIAIARFRPMAPTDPMVRRVPIARRAPIVRRVLAIFKDRTIRKASMGRADPVDPVADPVDPATDPVDEAALTATVARALRPAIRLGATKILVH
jgi:hypothetical protein